MLQSTRHSSNGVRTTPNQQQGVFRRGGVLFRVRLETLSRYLYLCPKLHYFLFKADLYNGLTPPLPRPTITCAEVDSFLIHAQCHVKFTCKCIKSHQNYCQDFVFVGGEEFCFPIDTLIQRVFTFRRHNSYHVTF